MPSANWTVPDSSPWIRYEGAWFDSDSFTEDYNNGTFHFTNVTGASAVLNFNGTGVTIWGANRPNHGEYTVTLDGNVTSLNGMTTDRIGLFNLSIYHQSGLDPSRSHSITLTNTPDGAGDVDIDWIEIEVGDGNTAETSHDIWLDDTSANITFDQNWQIGQGLTSYYYNNTFRTTNTLDAKATIDFYGSAIALYGAVSVDHGNFNVSLDGAVPTTFNGAELAFRPQMLLYMANNLPKGLHQAVLSNAGNGSNGHTDLDYAIVTVWSASNSSSSDPTQPTHKSELGAIVGGAAGGVVFLALLLGGLLFWFCRRRRRRASYVADVNNEDSATHLPPHAAFINPFVKVPVNLAASTSGHAPLDEAMPPPTYNYVFGEPVPDASAGRVVPETSSAVRPLPSPPVHEKT